VKTLPGKPDIVFVSQKVAIFCDGDFWHGRNWNHLSGKLRAGSNPSYWTQKIKTNRQRDRRTDKLLKREGWIVLRFWETDIHRDPAQAANKIVGLVRASQRGHDAIY
jgi:DNA mismatch endonuclease (patch repair protein)